MSDASISCPVCGAHDTTAYYADAQVRLRRCRACGLKFQAPLPTPEALAALYARDYYETCYPTRVLACQERLFAARLERLERLAGGEGLAPVLEVGVGRGMFLEAARQRGLLCQGLDIAPVAADMVSARLGVPVHVGEMVELSAPGSGFGCVHMNHVLEHMPDPGGALVQAARLLRPGGLLYVEVPRQSNLLNLLSGMVAGGEFGFSYFPGHLYLFSTRSLALLVTRAGLSPLVCTIEGMAAPHRFVRGVHYASPLAHLIKGAAGGLRLERLLGGGNLLVVARKGGEQCMERFAIGRKNT
ncbi:class I SAM-dependent methyltransferase [Desulfovibrio sp. JY]|nr:class I SAM-dependent methyltransferase [Desulfovibrio sp. JY]